MKFCPECNNKINATYQFCPRCGAKLPLNQSSFKQNNNDSFNGISNNKKNYKNKTIKKSSELESDRQEPSKMNKTTTIVAIIIITMIISVSIVFLFIDVDNDELSNLKEIQMGTSLFNSDTDNDLLLDGEESDEYNTNPLKMDSDNDGLDDYDEIKHYSSDPLDEDCDNDGLNDGDEINTGSSLFDKDTDDDGYQDGNDNHPTTHEWKLMDSDNDGWNDYKEYYETGTDRHNSDTDGDGYQDSSDSHPTTHEWKLMDSDNDGWNDYKEYYEKDTDRFDSDSDNDEYIDSSDPHPNTHEWKLMDSDNDGWNDYKEYYEIGTSVNSVDTDRDGAPDPRDAHPLSAARTITRYYEWEYPTDWYSSITWTWTISLSQDLYLYISDLDRITEHSEWSSYTLDQTVLDLAIGLSDAAESEGFDYYQTVDFVLSFVQSMQYTSDDVTTGYDEYPRYPIETLVDGGGDCEDTSFLVSGILNQMGYNVCLLSFPGHLAVGVEGDESYPGTYYDYQGKRYYYCETTAEGWTMGEIPESSEFETATIIPI